MHTWVEVFLDGEWVGLEGVILDQNYIAGVRKLVGPVKGAFAGYAIATRDIEAAANDWAGRSTQIQDEGVVRNFGVFASPDKFYAAHGPILSRFKRKL